MSEIFVTMVIILLSIIWLGIVISLIYVTLEEKENKYEKK